MLEQNKKPWGFCKTPEEKCTMNYCDDNGCQNRVRNLVPDQNTVLEQIIKNIEQRDFFEKRYDEDSDQELWFVNTGFIPDNAPVYFEDKELIKATEKMIEYLHVCYESERSSIGKVLRNVGNTFFTNSLNMINIIKEIKRAVFTVVENVKN